MSVDPTVNFPHDPRELDLGARHHWCQRLVAQQRSWLTRMCSLAEPKPAADFPAFLLATPPFTALASRLAVAVTRSDLPTATQDEVDRFVDAFGDYLRTKKGEDVFDRNARRAG